MTDISFRKTRFLGLICSFLFLQSVFAQPIELQLQDFQPSSSGRIDLAFDISLPPGQKLNLAAKSFLKIHEFKDSQWSDIAELDLNQSVGFMGQMKRSSISPKISTNAEKLKVTGTLIHCPKSEMKGKNNFCVIQPIKGVSAASKEGSSQIVSVISGSMKP